MINYRYDLRDMDYSDAAEIIFKDVGHEPEWFETGMLCAEHLKAF